MATIKELEQMLAASQGLVSAKRLPELESIYEQLRQKEQAAVKDPFSITLEDIRGLRALIPHVEAAINRAKAGIKRSKASA